MVSSIMRFVLSLLITLLCFAHVNLAHAQTDVSADAASTKSRQQEAAELYKESNWLAATGKREQAIASYDAFDAKFGKDDDLAIQILLAKGLINRASILGNSNRLSEEVIALDGVILRFSDNKSPQFAEHVAAAFNNKIYALKRQGKLTEALLEYDRLEARFGQNPTPQVRAAVAMGLFNKAQILEDLGELIASVKTHEEVVNRYAQDDNSEVRQQVLTAMVNQALVLNRLNKTTDKVLTYLAINRSFGVNQSTAIAQTDRLIDAASIRENVALIMQNRFYELKNYDAKLAAAEELERQFTEDESDKILGYVRNVMNSMGYASILRAKEFWANKPLRKQLLNSAIDRLQQAHYLQLKIKANANLYWFVDGNLGYALFLSGDSVKGKNLTRNALKYGIEKAIEAQRADAKLFRVEPQDTRYQAMLNKLWANFGQK
jgi:hypothetical protein